ncbi:MAG: RNA pseudouridine synthase, partial [Proteobacteria bacterium]|nr:RNA pseudouridine synthase [Candidatus Fonsibacter sp. PEL5]
KLSTIGGELRPGIVHRIDKGTSGLLVVAKNDNAHVFLSKQFAEHTIKRAYEVLVYGRIKPSSGQISSMIGRSKFNRKKMSINTSRGKDAVTNYKTIEFFSGKKIPDISFLECRLETGRTHQIRVHLSSHGNPIIGDQIYGKQNKFIRDIDPKFKELLDVFKRQALHAKSIGFIHPTTKKEVYFECEKPKDFENLLKIIKKLKF